MLIFPFSKNHRPAMQNNTKTFLIVPRCSSQSYFSYRKSLYHFSLLFKESFLIFIKLKSKFCFLQGIE